MKIYIFHATAGQGHKKVAEVIAQAFKKRSPEHDVQTFDILDLIPRIPAAIYPAVYFYAVKFFPKIWGWFYEALDQPKFYKMVYPLRRFHNALLGRAALKKISDEKPDVIINCHFFSAEHFAYNKRKGVLQSQLLTVITDFFPHSFWINKGTDIYWVMGEEGKMSLANRGVPTDRVQVGGIPVADAFRPSGRKREIRDRWGFHKDRLTLLFTSGSFGLGQQEAILKELALFKDNIQCFVVCGHNQALQNHLQSLSWAFPIQIFGFIDFMADLMEASDVVLAKTGGSTTTESLTKGIPLVILDPIPGQETRNADFLLKHNASFTLQKPEQIKLIIKAVLETPTILEEKFKEIRKIARPNASEDLATFVLETFFSGHHASY